MAILSRHFAWALTVLLLQYTQDAEGYSVARNYRRQHPGSSMEHRLCHRPHYSHSNVISPLSTSSFNQIGGSLDSTSSMDLSHLCSILGASPVDLLRLESTADGVRGVYLNRAVQKGDILLKLPLDSCLRDDLPPAWFLESMAVEDNDTATIMLNPSDWATRLAASLLDLQLGSSGGGSNEGNKGAWLALLPDPTFLRSSLPIHWKEDTLASARSTALELAVDSAYFSRAEAMSELMRGLQTRMPAMSRSEDELQTLCDNALDLIQTRSCRVERDDDHGLMQWGTPIRVLAPIFDFINHGSVTSSTNGRANAAFALEGEDSGASGYLVVRARMDLNAKEEILIDYGASARPAWRCLASYGFVPEYHAEEEDEDDDNVAEVYMDGVRYEVGPSIIPFDMVERVEAQLRAEEWLEELRTVPEIQQNVATELTPTIALRIAKRVSDVAFQLLLESDGSSTILQGAHSEEENYEIQAPQDMLSNRLAASLRWSQHKTLLACALGLRDWAAQQG